MNVGVDSFSADQIGPDSDDPCGYQLTTGPSHLYHHHHQSDEEMDPSQCHMWETVRLQ